MGPIFIVFGMTRPGFEPTTFQSQGGHSTTRPLSWLLGTNEKSARMKSSGTAAVGFLVVTVLWRLVIGGNPKSVWCRWKTPCLLEANFPIRDDDVVIHWERWLPSKLQVHKFDYGKDQLQEQDQHFRGRTSLFKENIPKGNASLLLTNVLVADEGTYMCYVGTLTRQWRSFIKLIVVAGVTSSHFRLDDEDQLICSSDGIFPQPELRWSTEPALPDALRNTSQVQQETQTQLYNINGSLALAGYADPDLKYICDISTTYSSQRITWRTNRSTSLQTSYWWIVGLVVALTVLVLAAMLVYLKMRGKAAKSSSRDPEEESELSSVKGVEGESEKSNQTCTTTRPKSQGAWLERSLERSS